MLATNVEHMIVNTTRSSNFDPDRFTGNALDNVIDVQSNQVAVVIDGGVGAEESAGPCRSNRRWQALRR
ncbi:MAG: hypothetical protein IPG63_17725 [Xanthomonadales bacterium]|nr:hypothetical protein [Xanthomonadales bacterium]